MTVFDQSALLAGFRTDFTSSVWNFCQRVADVRPRYMSLAARSEEKRLFSQAKSIYTINMCSKAFFIFLIILSWEFSMWKVSSGVVWNVLRVFSPPRPRRDADISDYLRGGSRRFMKRGSRLPVCKELWAHLCQEILKSLEDRHYNNSNIQKKRWCRLLNPPMFELTSFTLLH